MIALFEGYIVIAGSDYSEAAIQLARAVAEKRGITSVRWVVDDLLHTSISDRYASPMFSYIAEVACGVHAFDQGCPAYAADRMFLAAVLS